VGILQALCIPQTDNLKEKDEYMSTAWRAGKT